jgi:hypothetical protein
VILGKAPAVLSRFVRKVSGGSQPILAEASDGELYIVKFSDNPQGPNLLFNENMGRELYRVAKIPVPCCRQLLITSSFIEQNPTCWMETQEGRRRPSAGLCFGSLFLGGKGVRLYELLPGSYYKRVTNLESFWHAWLLDACASHADNRQALFVPGIKSALSAVFIDHGCMFGGPDGKLYPSFNASRYLDPRVYPGVGAKHIKRLSRSIVSLDVDHVWLQVKELPDEWVTPSALRRLSESLSAISCSHTIESTLEGLLESCIGAQPLKRDDCSAKHKGSLVLGSGLHAAEGR